VLSVVLRFAVKDRTCCRRLQVRQARAPAFALCANFYPLSPAEASASTNQGATIAAHAQHVRNGLSLMNEWARDGGNPFANARWDDAWKVAAVDALAWDEIRTGLHEEAQRWLEVLQSPREVNGIGLAGMISSMAHLAYHVGAIRQIGKTLRGPKEGTFKA
jgi:hypothetical protein